MPRSATPPGRPPPRDTPGLVLDAAERLAQTRGFNGFSYADVAAQVGITTASLHYHFPSKADLGRALVGRYTTAFQTALASIERREPGAVPRLQGYARIYVDILAADRMCLCGMLAAEYETLPVSVQTEVRRFFDANEGWLSTVLERGRAAGEVAFAGPPRDAARHLAATLEGAMLLARPYRDAGRLSSDARRIIADLTRGCGVDSPPPAKAPPSRPKRSPRARRR